MPNIPENAYLEVLGRRKDDEGWVSLLTLTHNDWIDEFSDLIDADAIGFMLRGADSVCIYKVEEATPSSQEPISHEPKNDPLQHNDLARLSRTHNLK